MKICLDPGHYGSDYNPGVAAGYVESNFTWAYALLMRERLQRYGVEVIFTRDSKDEDLGLQARGKKSEGCDLFVSIHSNATSDPNRNAVFCHWSMVSGGELIAKEIGKALTDFLRSEWGEIQKEECYYVESEKHPGQDYYGVLLGASKVGTPAVIVEHSFHTNKRYCEWAMIPGNIDKMCDAEVTAIAKYYGLSVALDDMYYIYLPKNLKKGDKGEDVKKLQTRMRQIDGTYDVEVEEHSFYEGHPDGSFGGKMVTTMKRFQHELGIEETGELDSATRAILNNSVIEWYHALRDSKSDYDSMSQSYKKLAVTIDESVEGIHYISQKLQEART